MVVCQVKSKTSKRRACLFVVLSCFCYFLAFFVPSYLSFILSRRVPFFYSSVLPFLFFHSSFLYFFSSKVCPLNYTCFPDNDRGPYGLKSGKTRLGPINPVLARIGAKKNGDMG